MKLGRWEVQPNYPDDTGFSMGIGIVITAFAIWSVTITVVWLVGLLILDEAAYDFNIGWAIAFTAIGYQMGRLGSVNMFTKWATSNPRFRA